MGRPRSSRLTLATLDPGGDGSAGASRAHELRRVLAELSALSRVRGGLMVTPDGLVIASTLPSTYGAEALAALGATLGRELELGADRLGRGAFRTAAFSGTEGTLIVGGHAVGFIVLVADAQADPAPAQRALRASLPRLGGPVTRA